MFLVTGAGGQLAACLKFLKFQAIYADSKVLDITDMQAIQHFISHHKITFIINCAAYTAVDKAESESEQAYKVNVLGAENLAKTNLPLIHISTDYVFDGTNYMPYTEQDAPCPIGVYGQTKLQGEQAILTHARQAVIIRTSWLYSEFNHNFLKTIVRLGQEKSCLNVVADQVGTPTYAVDLAEIMIDIAQKMQQSPQNDTKEIYHFSNQGVCSWYDFAVAIMKLKGLSCKVMPIPATSYPTPAKRPYYSVLDKTKIQQAFHFPINHWQESLEKCLKNLS